MIFKLFKNKRPAYFSYYITEYWCSRRLMFIFYIVFCFVGISIAFIPGIEKPYRYTAVLFFLGGPIAGFIAYYLKKHFFNDDPHIQKKLHKIFATYVVSLEANEKDAINTFLLKGSSFDEFEADSIIIESLLKKQIIYQDKYFGKNIYKIERWAFDYFYTYKL